MKIGEDAIPSLIQALEEPDEEVDVVASITLQMMGKVAVPALIGALQGKSELARKGAAIALSHMGAQARDALPALRDLAARGDKSAAKAIPKIEAEPPPGPEK